MGLKMNSRIIRKNHAAYAEIGFLTKLILMPYDRATAMPPLYELMKLFVFTQRSSIPGPSLLKSNLRDRYSKFKIENSIYSLKKYF